MARKNDMSVGFEITFANNTPHAVRLNATVGSPGDWDGDNPGRPDNAIKDIIVDPFTTSASIHLERHNYRSTAPFTVTANFSSGSNEIFTLDGCDATENRNDREVLPGAGSSQSTSVLQVTSDALERNWNRMTIYLTPQVSTADWMGRLQGDPSLLHITIPGTHDTGTYPGYGGVSAQCQTMDIAAQLLSGIRFMDLRLVLDGQDLLIYHSSANQHLSFRNTVLPAIVDFLDKHSTECVIICVNQERGDSSSFDSTLHDILMYGVPSTKLYDRNDTNAFPLTVKGLAGCVVLVRRDKGMTFGLDMTQWPDNPPDQTFPAGTGTIVRLQDNYHWTDLAGAWDNKWNIVSPFLDLARIMPPNYSQDAWKTWFINFTSASGIVVPWDFATGAVGHVGINRRLARNLVKHTSREGRLGTVVMDFPEEPGKSLLTRLLLGTNTYT
jgi:1-phosphatidylinositol phosphodiesterase